MIAAVIPTRYHPPELAELLRVLIADGVEPIVLRSEVFDHRIYRMWNAGTEEARAKGADYIAVLNDDVAIRPRTLPFLAGALMEDPALGVVYPDVNACWCDIIKPGAVVKTAGTWGSGGMTGFCFMFRADLGIAFDESYHWWYGDDAFERDVRAAGWAVGRLSGLPVRHHPDGSASRDWARLAPLIEQDRARWAERSVEGRE